MAEAATVLVVEDEPAIAESVAYALRREGFEVRLAFDLERAWEQHRGVNLIVLDLMLPDGSGFDLIERLRAEPHCPAVIVLSSRDSEADRVRALEWAADDYVTKPFSPREVVARVRAVLRRAAAEHERRETRSEVLRTDPGTRRASFGDQELELTRVEFDLLHQLLTEPDRVFARSELIDRVWGDGFAITDRTIDSHIKSLRRKVNAAGAPTELIETVRGVGYRIASRAPTQVPPAS
jgi:two-component system catabolic regulation response regulator CreB